jgi:hypothetical protein
MMRARAGMALTEVLVAAVLSGVVLASSALLLSGQSRLARSITERSERNDAARSVLMILHSELNALLPEQDLRAVARDSIASRIFRGVAVVCGFRSGWIYARYRGLRMPDPAKDSVVQLGIENAAAFASASVSDDACPHTSSEHVIALSWRVAPPLIGSIWLVFESGSYHLNANALRYRRGLESRQPITNEVINDRASSFASVGDTLVRGMRIQIAQRADGAVLSSMLSLRNSR